MWTFKGRRRWEDAYLSDDADELAISNWVDDVVKAFCGKPAMKTQFGFAIAELMGD